MYKNGGTLSGAEAQLSCFNPCFIGSMYKNTGKIGIVPRWDGVSILVLLDLCIKTREFRNIPEALPKFQSLFYWIYV